MPAPTITAGLRQLLLPHLPFSRMSSDDLDYLLAQIEIAYYGPNEVVLKPEAAAPDHCLIVKQGRVRGLREGNAEQVAFDAGVGDCFPVGALLAQRPVTLTYVSVGDSFCLRFPRAAFETLTQRSAPFLDYCKRRLGSLLDLSRQELQSTYAAQASAERTMNLPLAELLRGPPITCRREDSLRDAFSRMHGAHVGSILVTEPDGQGGETVVGILTRTDLIGRVILPEVPLATPIGELMSTGVLTLDAQATASDAVLMMAEHSIRHVPVVQTRGAATQVIGVVSERELFTLQRLSVQQLATAIRRATDAEALASVAADIRRLSHHLVAQGVAAAQMTRVISHLNDQLTVRLLTLACDRYGVDAESFCWLALGSEGRSEQTIATDQDNGIIYQPETARPEALAALAAWVNDALAACGFPLCTGEVMARNPKWLLPAAGWEALFADWIGSGNPDALLNASIFFDFRGLFGNKALAQALRESVTQRAQKNLRFLKQMSDNALRNTPPPAPTVFDRLLGEDLGKAPMDLKLHGTVPFVDAARIWALAAGLAETNTAERLRQLAAAGRLPAEDAAAWIDAFEFCQLLRLRAQHWRAEGGAAAHEGNPNLVDPARLSALDRRIVQEAFRQGRRIQQRLELDFPG
jgi:CBS domain-containing protein